VIAVNAGYLAVTLGESLLAPVFPLAARDLGLDVETAGLAFGLLAASIAAGNLAGGLVLSARGPKLGAIVGLAVAAAGGTLAWGTDGAGGFFAAQALLGLGSGVFFAPGISAAGALGGRRRRGLFMGFFGLAFSGGLALAALLAAALGEDAWRIAFFAAALLALAAAVGFGLARIPEYAEQPEGEAQPRLRQVLGLPLLVGGVAAASQYGTVSFFPTFAVAHWGLSPAVAAIALGAARVLSLPGKVAAGHAADRARPLVVARRLGMALALLGAWWTLVPGPWPSLWAAAVFAATVSALGPVANLLAFERLQERGMLLGAFRSAQIGLGAGMSAAIGGSAAFVGLRPALAVAAIVPGVLLALQAAPRRVRPVAAAAGRP
jgi:FSR family fosmidomycin resistance protein-like MFS transporter